MNSLPIEKILTFHDVIILIKSVVIRIKIATTIIYFLEKEIRIKINPIENIFK